ncbi:MAG TPA: chromosomal replication initiator DnaA [Xanthobacteraceae bacterium]|jgi:chromosomal replication initiation ATPase DnaA
MSVASRPRQLALALEHPESFAREDFLSGPSNAAGLALIEGWPDWPSRAIVLAGPEGSGKSHLAAIWAQESGARFLAARALTASNLPAAFATGALVVEDAAAGQVDERALFHLLNLAREEEAFMLITARTPPAGWSLGIRDLSSRLKALPVVTISAPDDALLRAVLVKLFADRQLAIEENLVSYVVMHIERSFAAARTVVARLDAEALRQKRPLTRALAAQILRSG